MTGTYEISYCLVHFSGRYDNIRSEHRLGTREAFVKEAASFGPCQGIIFGPAGGMSGPQGAGTTITTLRQAAVSLKRASPQARSAGSTRGSAKNNQRGHAGLTRE